ncbi:hypothetical protein [Rhizobium sp. TRM95796]|uniref:hypothetical protein n=1 Tax=Rhizobium sp. TRM95796 TaxID=2979862 RepID=UPI0021E6F568|nr:hypothetical protein [Rhizobium sp. TRM95796]MCV3764942.1 hypothetical protein [Rhizobium sp. TRM95796]
MRRLVWAAIAMVSGFGSAEAAVSGYYDSVEQIGIILGSSEVANAVHQAPIGAISNTGTRKDGAKEWTVRVQDCDLKVYLIPVLPEGPGKTTYQLDIPNVCR